MTIKIYTTPTCPWCKKVKEYLKSKNKEYEEVDVSKDPKKAAELVKISGQTGVPVVIINGKTIVGFDKEKIDEALK